MRLLFIRHAEPDYVTDGLTEKGRREAILLAKAASSLHMDHCFVSPLGRAQATAAYSLEAIGKTARTLPWLEELNAPVDLNQAPDLVAAYPGVKPVLEVPGISGARENKAADQSQSPGSGVTGPEADVTGPEADVTGPGVGVIRTKTGVTRPGVGAISPEAGMTGPEAGSARYKLRIPWDVGARYYADHPELADPVRWRESGIYRHSRLPRRYDEVKRAFDDLLASYGYVHENGLYRVERENRETLAFFCHFGIICTLLSIIWNVSPFFLWQSLVMLPSTVTELISEEREQGAALFRAQRIGDQSHLFAGSEPPSFYARFCEVYSDFSEETGRHF